jgi:hypothetical protein
VRRSRHVTKNKIYQCPGRHWHAQGQTCLLVVQSLERSTAWPDVDYDGAEMFVFLDGILMN